MRLLIRAALWLLLLNGLEIIKAKSNIPTAGGGPVAPPMVFFANRGEEVILRLGGYDINGRPLLTTLVTSPASSAGSLYELSQLFLTQNLQPKKGKGITQYPFTLPSLTNNRVLFISSTSTSTVPNQAWGNFSYRVMDGNIGSNLGTVWIIPNHRKLVSSEFRTDTEGWKIGGTATLSRESFSRGSLSQYLVGTDSDIRTSPRTTGDANLWRFIAPSQFLGNKIVAYGSTLSFTMGAFAGDFSIDQLQTKAPLITLECASCAGGAGIRLGHFLTPEAASKTLDGKTKKITVPLLPSSFLKDPKNSLLRWQPITECDFVHVLSMLSQFTILGDWTIWYETVALDDVVITVPQPWPGIPKTCYHLL
jgi:hypothetical protein